MTLRFIYILLLLCLLLLTCDHGNGAKNLKEKYSSTNFHKNCDEAEEKTSSKSSYITRLESKYELGYNGAYAADEPNEKIARLESKYELGYNGAYAANEPNEEIALLEGKYELGYGDTHVVDETKEKIARLESKYDLGYNGAYEADEPNEKIARPESKYELGYGGAHVVDETKEKIASLESKYDGVYAADEPNGKIARLESKYELGYGGAHVVDETKEKIARLERQYELGYNGAYVVDEPNEKIALLESKYELGYNGAYASDEPNEKIARLESKYELGYNGAYASDERNKKIAHLENKYNSGYVVDEVEGKSSTPSSSQGAEHHNREHDHIHDHGHDDDIGSEDVGVFTIDDVSALDVGRKLSTFFSIRNHSLYPGFLPREVADSIPFSSADIPKILQFFSVSPESPKGKAVKKTISTCEGKPAKGEIKICVTSSESMLEFLKTAFGEADIKFISTSNPTMTTPIIQSYTVLEPPREIESPRKVPCHPLPYLYGIYMCHYDGTETKVFKVPLVGDSGDKVDALIVCHMNTSAWGPKHVAFSLLGTKPGAPVCHSFSEGHGVWVQSSTKKVAAM